METSTEPKGPKGPRQDRRLTVSMPTEMYEASLAAATEYRQTLSAWVRWLIAHELKREGREEASA